MDYMPEEEMEQERYPDREWFWDIANTVVPVWTTAYMDEAQEKRLAAPKEIPKTTRVSPSAKVLEQLKQFSYK